MKREAKNIRGRKSVIIVNSVYSLGDFILDIIIFRDEIICNSLVNLKVRLLIFCNQIIYSHSFEGKIFEHQVFCGFELLLSYFV